MSVCCICLIGKLLVHQNDAFFKGAADEEEKNSPNRIAHKVPGAGMAALFREQNDMAVGLSSMKTPRGGVYPKLRVEVLFCDRVHSYAIAEGQRAITKWIEGRARAGRLYRVASCKGFFEWCAVYLAFRVNSGR